MNSLNPVSLALVALLPFLIAPLSAFVARFNRYASAWVAAIVTLIGIALLLPHIPSVAAGETVLHTQAWIPQIGLWFSFRLDGLALLFALLILVIGLLIVIYARYYLSSRDSMGRFYAYLLMFMGSMLGIVLSENLLQLLIFWELTSLTSFLLISYWQDKEAGRQGARMALAVTGAGGLALLGGILLIGHVVGSYQLTDVLAAGDVIRNHEWYRPILILCLLGVFTKSAQFPFHFWLPHAMAAPTPVSAYLHSATMVKAGIFLLARLFPALSGTPEWVGLVSTAGLLTLILGAYTALVKPDLKGLLAYSTLSHLGLITLLFGFSSPLATVAALFHIINHATFKASLFMVAGIVDHETGTRDMRRLSGLFRFMPHTAVLAIIASAAMAGVPLLNGFLSKEMFFEQALLSSQGTLLVWLVPALVTFAAVFSVAYSIRFIHDVFFGPVAKDLPKTPHEPPRLMKIPVDILVILCLVVGMAPMWVAGSALSWAVAGSLQTAAPAFSIAIWHGFNLPLLMSALAMALGVVVYLGRTSVYAFHERVMAGFDGKAVFERTLARIIRTALIFTRGFDKGQLQHAASWVLVAAIVAGFIGFASAESSWLGSRALMPVDPMSVVMTLALIAASILTVVLHRQRLVSLIVIGVVGLIVALGFVKFSAPDLALTQLSVEIVTIVLLLLALFFLPQTTPKESLNARIGRDVLLAGLSGLGVMAITMAVLTRDFQPLSEFFLTNSVPGGGGTNVVNVILVDFRGFDTLGEIVVLALAALGIFALLQQLKLTVPAKDFGGRDWSLDPHPPIMQTLTRLLLPLMLLVAVFIFIRGHNLPGGGFIAGLIAAVALIAQYLANGISWTTERLRVDMHRVIGLGLAVATGTGIVAMLLGVPFLTSAFTYLTWPVVGTFEIASAIAFDIGVFLVVVGASVLSLVELGRLSHDAIAVPPEEHTSWNG